MKIETAWYNPVMDKLNLGQYREKYRRLRRGMEGKVVFEGVHAWKHAFRFGAEFEEILISDVQQIEELPENVLKKEEKEYILKNAIRVEEDFFDQLLPYSTRSKVLAIAKKPEHVWEDIPEDKPIVFLENPANPENIGMVLRVCAAFGAGALVVSGRNSPFSASVIRAGAGLVYALPVFHRSFSQDLFKGREVVVADAEGESIKKVQVPNKSVIIFGTEREGVSGELKTVCSRMIKLDMENNVSSLNLATSVSAFLYGADFAQ